MNTCWSQLGKALVECGKTIRSDISNAHPLHVLGYYCAGTMIPTTLGFAYRDMKRTHENPWTNGVDLAFAGVFGAIKGAIAGPFMPVIGPLYFFATQNPKPKIVDKDDFY